MRTISAQKYVERFAKTGFSSVSGNIVDFLHGDFFCKK